MIAPYLHRLKHPRQAKVNVTPSAHKLTSLLERDESPPSGSNRNIDALVSSPVAPPNTAMPYTVQTPQTASRIYPSKEEMHPSKVHQSTIKEPRSVFQLNASAGTSPTKSVMEQDTPTKLTSTLPGHMSSPTFDFSFAGQDSSLSAEAQKIMDSVREEAAKIKAQMQSERDKQKEQDGETNQLYGVGGRKIAQAKGKSGRFSDVHKQQFRKMDSIAGHASTWKTKLQANVTSLKRSKSKAGLDDPERGLPSSKSFKSLNASNTSERLENTSPSKRMRKDYNGDTSAARPVSQDDKVKDESTPGRSRPQGGTLPSAVTTPTKSSLARSASVKSLKTPTMIPSLSRSNSTKSVASPVRPKTEGSNRYLSFSKIGNMKSILHRAPPKFSDDPHKVAAGTHLPTKEKMDLDKALPSLPATPSNGPTIKHVNFSPSTKSLSSLASAFPSKIPSCPTTSHGPAITTQAPISYPNLPSPNVTARAPRTPKPSNNTTPQAPATAPPSAFTFRAPTSLSFPKSAPHTPTIRQVRPSGITTPLPSAFSDISALPSGKKRRHEDDENVDPAHETEEDERPAKKARSGNGLDVSPSKQAASKARMGTKIPKMKGGLSLGRLNVLARPKERR